MTSPPTGPRPPDQQPPYQQPPYQQPPYQQPPYQQPPYVGPMPGYGPPPAGPWPAYAYGPGPHPLGPPPEPPAQVRRAALLLYVLAGLQLLGFAISLVSRSWAEPSFGEGVVVAPPAGDLAVAVGLAISTTVSTGMAVALIVSGRWLVRGRSWSRVLPTVLVSLGLAGATLTLLVTALTSLVDLPAWSIAQTASMLVVGVAFLLHAWTGPANSFFAAVRDRR